MLKVWVDDIRTIPNGYDIWFKTVNETIDFLKDHSSEISVLDLDHDAGDFYSQGGDYIHILDWLEFMKISIPISIHSGNPVGIKNMQRIISKNNWVYIPQEDECICDIIL